MKLDLRFNGNKGRNEERSEEIDERSNLPIYGPPIYWLAQALQKLATKVAIDVMLASQPLQRLHARAFRAS